MAALNNEDLIVLAHALAGEKVSLDNLADTLKKMLENLTSYFGDKKRARRVLLRSIPTERRHVFEAMLKRNGPGRPKGIPRLHRLLEHQMLSLAEITRGQDPAASNREIARAYLRVVESKKNPKDKDIRRATALLKRARSHKKRGTKILRF